MKAKIVKTSKGETLLSCKEGSDYRQKCSSKYTPKRKQKNLEELKEFKEMIGFTL